MSPRPLPPIPLAAGSPADIAGLKVGHASDRKAATGATVILCERGAVCGLDVRGGASGLRNPTVALTGHLVERVHAIFFAGGSAFGLDAAAGVMRFLEERGVGFPVRGHRVPIVTGAILFDLAVGKARRRPDPALLYRACRKASRRPVPEGTVGAGTGATVGKLFGMGRSMKGGTGTACLSRGSLRVASLAIVNAFGDIRDPITGSLVAGARASASGSRLVGSEAALRNGVPARKTAGDSTTLALVATNAKLDRESACRLASASQVALARCLSPAHTRYDGDLVYALATGEVGADLLTVEVLAVEALSLAIPRAIYLARGLAGIPAWRDRSGWRGGAAAQKARIWRT